MSEQPRDQADGPLGGREPTSHERRSGQPWDASYQDGPAPWEIGGPQPAVARLASEGGFTGSVLDAGCGSGDNGLHLASLGLQVLGFDVAETAVNAARTRADELDVDATFVVADAFHLEQVDRRFDTVLDSGLFHSLDDDERRRYAASLATVTDPGSRVHVLCFGDDGPDQGPHPVSRSDFAAAFTADAGWNVVTIEPERIHTRFHGDDGAPAWLATIERL